MFSGPGRDGDLNLRVRCGEFGECILQKRVHALGATSPIAVVEIESFARQDEGADAILQKDWSVGTRQVVAVG